MSTYGLNLEILNSTEESSKRGKTNNSGYKREGGKKLSKITGRRDEKAAFSHNSDANIVFSKVTDGNRSSVHVPGTGSGPSVRAAVPVGFNLSLPQIASLPAAFPAQHTLPAGKEGSSCCSLGSTGISSSQLPPPKNQPPSHP